MPSVISRVNQLTMKSLYLRLIPIAVFSFFEFNGCDQEEAADNETPAVEQNDNTGNRSSATRQNRSAAVAKKGNQKPKLVTFEEAQQDIRVVETSTIESQNRVEIINKSISFRAESGRAPDKFRFYHTAEVRAPKSPHGDPLSATCVQIQGNYAFVSWHWNRGDADYYGVLEIYNLNDPALPKLQSTLTAANIDFNDLYADIDDRGTGKVYAVGSENVSTKNLESPGYFGEFPVKNGRFHANHTARVDLDSYSGNCVIKHNENLFTVSGNTNGSFSKHDLKTGETKAILTMDGFKYLAANDKFLLILKQGRPQSQLAVYDSEAPDFKKPLRTISVGAITPENGKNVVYIDGEFAYISTGKLGMKVYDLMTSSSTPFYTYHTLLPGAANGVAADDDFIYIANGSSGLHVLHKNQFMLAGNFSHSGSANFVTAGNNFVIVANGRGGLTILRREPVV